MAGKEPSARGFEIKGKKHQTVKLNKTDLKIIDYISDHFEEDFEAKKMSKDTKISRSTLYLRFHVLKKAGVITHAWKINPYALDSTIILFWCKITKDDPEKVIKLIHKKEFIRDIYHLHPEEYMIELIVTNVAEFRAIRKLLANQGIEMINSWIALDKMSESQPGKFIKNLKKED